MTEPQLKLLLKLVTPLILHDPTHIQPITAEERLVLTLRILATGISQTAGAHSFAICQTTVGNIFKETTKAIYTALKDAYIGEPSKDRWQQNTESFEAMWNFPNCIGAIDGKHVQINVQIFYVHYKYSSSFTRQHAY
ncbi:hypothetical protein RvY_19023-1 [Ramazzottius varieornatus]|uniref:DDE Tnp4 domain-containing protein n=1 Tax=Ramazzottius varieornatus TaxID=947166 RepID=A0A1D1W7Y0_RAMVA|nr:hypothetical protein RvY_19023-1 [Ramazzottius varieornatus]